MLSAHEDPALAKEVMQAEANDATWVLPANEDEWHAMRAKHITSTESSALFGLSPYNTLFELWHRKREGVVYTIGDNERMAWGRRLQDAIAHGVGEQNRWNVSPLREYAFIEDARMGSSFDFQAYDPERGTTGILEIKNVDYSVYRREWLDDEAPDHIEIQLQHQLEISGRDWGCIACLVGGNTLKLIVRERDREMGAAIRSEIAAFWQSIAKGCEPRPDFSVDSETINRLYAKSGGGERTLTDPRLEVLARQYLQAIEDEKTASAIKESASAEIKTIIGDADVVFCNGHKISAKAIAENPGKPITADMVGQVIGARKGYRPLRVSEIKSK